MHAVDDTPEMDTELGESVQNPCVLLFNANDPSAGSGLAADVLAVASMGVHAMPVTTGVFLRDTRSIDGFHALPDEWVTEQAQTVMQDVEPTVIKVGFAGSASNLAAIAQLADDYDAIPLLAVMPDLSWWTEDQIDEYQEAMTQLLPQVSVLVGNYNTLLRWLLPDWDAQRQPLPRDLAQAASSYGVPYTLVTGHLRDDQHLDNVLCTPESIVYQCHFERIDAPFLGAGDTLSAALTALLATGMDLPQACAEALQYVDQALIHGHRPGMGHVLPSLLFWAQAESDEDEGAVAGDPLSKDAPAKGLADLNPLWSSFDHETRH
jgi:hydroxymethylpyrimidine/phosphomethylpyrimidine kinase